MTRDKALKEVLTLLDKKVSDTKVLGKPNESEHWRKVYVAIKEANC